MTLFTPDAAKERNTRDWIDWGTDGGMGEKGEGMEEGRGKEHGGRGDQARAQLSLYDHGAGLSGWQPVGGREGGGGT